jgi:hypothetical protein
MMRNDSRVHQAEVKKKEKERKEKNEQHFPLLERSRPFARSLACFLLVSFPIALMSCTKNTLTRPVAHSIMDMNEDSRMGLASKSHQ